MNYQKLDAALTVALNQVQNLDERCLIVFIHIRLDVDYARVNAFLQDLGVSEVTDGKDIYTATLSPNAISLLSEQPWVQHVRLSRKFRLLNN
jgi:hypothetical protein